MKKVLFLHGLESKPGGKKPSFLKKHGYVVLNPALPKSSFTESIRIAQDAIDSEEPDFIVGSSRGGAVALSVQPRNAKLILIAPAWKRFCKDIEKNGVSTKCVILHSTEDRIVSVEDSVELMCIADATLIKVGADHRMSDPDALEGILDAVRWLSK